MQFYPSFWRYRPPRNMFVGQRHGSSIIIFRSLRRRLDLFAQRQELASVFWECCGARIRLSRKSFSMLNYVAARSWKFFPKCIIHKKRYNCLCWKLPMISHPCSLAVLGGRKCIPFLSSNSNAIKEVKAKRLLFGRDEKIISGENSARSDRYAHTRYMEGEPLINHQLSHGHHCLTKFRQNSHFMRVNKGMSAYLHGFFDQ